MEGAQTVDSCHSKRISTGDIGISGGSCSGGHIFSLASTHLVSLTPVFPTGSEIESLINEGRLGGSMVGGISRMHGALVADSISVGSLPVLGGHL